MIPPSCFSPWPAIPHFMNSAICILGYDFPPHPSFSVEFIRAIMFYRVFKNEVSRCSIAIWEDIKS